jgi:hypothetical protein
MNEAWATVIVAAIGAFVSIVTILFNLKNRNTVAKIVKDHDGDQRIKEARKALEDARREKEDKFELSVLANHELTSEIARHIIDGNHLDRLNDKAQKCKVAEDALHVARAKVEEAYKRFNEVYAEVNGALK